VAKLLEREAIFLTGDKSLASLGRWLRKGGALANYCAVKKFGGAKDCIAGEISCKKDYEID